MKTRIKVWFISTAKPNPYGTGCAVVAADNPVAAKRLARALSRSWGEFFSDPFTYLLLPVAYEGEAKVIAHTELEPATTP